MNPITEWFFDELSGQLCWLFQLTCCSCNCCCCKPKLLVLAMLLVDFVMLLLPPSVLVMLYNVRAANTRSLTQANFKGSMHPRISKTKFMHP